MKLLHSAGKHSHPHSSVSTPSRRQFLTSLLAAGVAAPWALGQTPSRDNLAERYRQLSENYEREGLVEPFKGITTDGTVVPNLFEIAASGASTGAVREAATRYISVLNDQQLVRTMFPLDDVQWRKWMNQGYYTRQGVSFREMSAMQRQAAFGLMRASLSQKGFDLTRNIMRLNETLAEMTNDHLVSGEWGYYLTIMGRPSAIDPWGWQFQGPHAICNYFVLGDQVVMTPLFLGSEPTRAASGKYKGLEVLQKEQNDGLAMVRMLPPALQRQAVLNFSKTGNNNLTEAFKDNIVLDYAGVRAKELEARADADGVQLSLEPTDLRALSAELDAASSVLAESRSIQWSSEMPESPVIVLANGPHLRRLLLILIDNACRYTRRGGAVRLTLTKQDHDAVVTVSDTGIGIPPEDLARIFDRFYRAENARYFHSEGSGLGLSIAHWVATAHGGSLTVESSNGAGTSMRLRLHLREGNAD